MVERDRAAGKYGGRVVTRFPPEPNGYLHIGHAKSICLNFGLALEYRGVCNLRFDDTNPETEDVEYVESIQRDVRWLGFDWGKNLFHASDYFEQLYGFAVELIRMGKAYVDSLSEDEIREYRGTVTEPGRNSPHRDRSVEENLDLLARMRAGEFPDGAHVLRAKIDMASPNMKMRDPLLYRIRHASHYRRGDAWSIYPMYDFAHPLSDAIEGVTHSLCTLEFENNREIYDWLVDTLPFPEPPRQTEFARLNLTYTVMSKRKLLQLVERKLVRGWDDPRMPTLAALRRRGFTPEAIRDLCERVGVAKANSTVDVTLLEHCQREALNPEVPRVMCVLRPLKVVIENYPENQVEEFDAPLYPHDVPKEGTRKVPFSRTLYIDQEDFAEDPPKGFHRLSPGREVRLRYAYLVRCESVVKDANGEITELRCTYDPATRGGSAPDGRKVPGTLHWVSADHAVPV
ncbi:MAG TPA: glutamine--tRNA ligase/YqeY domain fusion protein, partial [Thermoanaerobaculia bacterium]|nr:glutamine--tRNA ligase/YqeY domain fusion protein [Thermoanaerobaculia bacterium]